MAVALGAVALAGVLPTVPLGAQRPALWAGPSGPRLADRGPQDPQGRRPPSTGARRHHGRGLLRRPASPRREAERRERRRARALQYVRASAMGDSSGL